MRKELLYNPALLIERIGEEISRRRRLKKLRGTPAANLGRDHLSTLEFIELAASRVKIITAYDLGANVGTWSLLARTLVPEAQIHAFEPTPVYQEGYLKNTNGLHNIHLHKVGAGAENKKEKFNLSGHSSSFLPVTENLLKVFPNERKTGEVLVHMVRLDDYVKENKIPFPQLMKLDVEGYEIEVLKGALECMKHCWFIILEVSFIERHLGQPLFHEVVQFMAGNGFHVFSFPHEMHLAEPIFSTDVLFMRVNSRNL